MGKRHSLADASPSLPFVEAKKAPASTLHGAEGHRERMRARLLRAGPDALADHELLEMVLFLAVPRRDTKAIARALLARFGSFGAVISASPHDLRSIEGLKERSEER